MNEVIGKLNPELKRQFIDETQNDFSKINRIAILNKFDIKEQETQRDLCTFDYDDIAPFILQGQLGMKYPSIEKALITIKKYKEFCAIHNVEGATGVDSRLYDLRASAAFRKSMVVNSADMAKCLDEIYPETIEDKPALSDLVRGYIWLGFSGIDDMCVSKIEKQHLDFIGQRIKYLDREYKIYPESVQVLRICCDSQELYAMKNRTYACYPRTKGDGVLRSIIEMQERKASTYFAGLLSRRLGILEDGNNSFRRISYIRAWSSGIFSRTYEAELSGEKYEEYLTKIAGEITEERNAIKGYKLEGRNTLRTKTLALAGDLKEDYLTWKQAFINQD